MKYVLGIIMIAVGAIFIIKTEWFLNMFGRINWAEQKLGAEGGTRLFYKLLGFFIIILSFMIMSGSIFSVFDMVFKR